MAQRRPCQQTQSKAPVSPFLVLHCLTWYFEILMWGAYALRWPRHGHALPSAGFDGRMAATGGGLVHPVMVAGAHTTALWYVVCMMRSDSASLFEMSVICSWLCYRFIADFKQAIIFCYLKIAFFFFFNPGKNDVRIIWKQHQCERLSLPWAPSDSSA